MLEPLHAVARNISPKLNQDIAHNYFHYAVSTHILIIRGPDLSPKTICSEVSRSDGPARPTSGWFTTPYFVGVADEDQPYSCTVGVWSILFLCNASHSMRSPSFPMLKIVASKGDRHLEGPTAAADSSILALCVSHASKSSEMRALSESYTTLSAAIIPIPLSMIATTLATRREYISSAY